MHNLNILLEINRRYNNNDKLLNLDSAGINNICHKLDDFFNKKFDLDKFIQFCIFLYNKNIFTAGNKQTILGFMDYVLDEYHLELDRETVKQDEFHKMSSSCIKEAA